MPVVIHDDDEEISDSDATPAHTQNNTVSVSNLQNNTVSASDLQNNTVSASDLQNNTVPVPVSDLDHRRRNLQAQLHRFVDRVPREGYGLDELPAIQAVIDAYNRLTPLMGKGAQDWTGNAEDLHRITKRRIGLLIPIAETYSSNDLSDVTIEPDPDARDKIQYQRRLLRQKLDSLVKQAPGQGYSDLELPIIDNIIKEMNFPTNRLGSPSRAEPWKGTCEEYEKGPIGPQSQTFLQISCSDH